VRNVCRTCAGGQIRTYKDLPTKTNPHVESWYNAREDMEMTATITAPMLASGFFWGCVLPYVLYELIVSEMRDSEVHSGKKLTFYPQYVAPEPAISVLPRDE
jgi:hypothetical protein